MAGRPTKYTPKVLREAKAYITDYQEHGHAFPSDVGLADVIGIGTTTLYRWADEEGKEEFRDILDEIDRKQQLVAWNKGLKGDYNPMLVKLLLGKHGYSDKQDNTHSSPDGSMSPPTKIEIVAPSDDSAD